MVLHHVTPFDIWEGAYIFALPANEFPRGTVFVPVVNLPGFLMLLVSSQAGLADQRRFFWEMGN